MANNNWVSGPADVVFDQLVDRYRLSEHEQIDIITSFFLSGIIQLGLSYLNENPEELSDFLQFVRDNYSPHGVRPSEIQILRRLGD